MKQKTIDEVKCNNCGNMITKPYVYHALPPSPLYDIDSIPIYNKKSTKINRVDLTGKQKINVYYYCDIECSDLKKRKQI